MSKAIDLTIPSSILWSSPDTIGGRITYQMYRFGVVIMLAGIPWLLQKLVDLSIPRPICNFSVKAYTRVQV